MKITRIETLKCSAFVHYTWVQIYTDEGIIGLGETISPNDPVIGYIHENVAPQLLGQDPTEIERHFTTLSRISALGGMGHRAIGAELRGLSAIDIALWDIFGQSVGLPIYRLLGGPVRDRIRAYNTCVGGGRYPDDYKAWHEGRAGELAQSLLDMGITAMKIWPFDSYASPPFDHIGGRSWGQHITPTQLDQGVQVFRDIRNAVGLEMDIALEMHLRWSLPAAIRIAHAVEEYQPMWFEDPMPVDNVDELAEFARRTHIPLLASESLGGRYAFRELLERNAVGIVMIEPVFAGGITEARRICNMAETYHRPCTMHDCAGPVVFAVDTHLCMAMANAMIQESVRGFWDGGFYSEIVTEIPDMKDGYLAAPSGPGLGTKLQPDFLKRSDLTIKVSE